MMQEREVTTVGRTRTKTFKIYMEMQKTLKSQSNLEKEKQKWEDRAPRCQTTLQRYSHQTSTLPGQKQKYRSVEQDRKPRDKPMH